MYNDIIVLKQKLLEYDLPIQIKEQLCYKAQKIDNNKNVVNADYIATGTAAPIIEKYVQKILPYYANTHSNASCGILMKNLIQNTKNYIRNVTNSHDKKIIFSGNGTTGAINHLIHCMNLAQYNKVNIILSIYEHNSNYLPWIELSKKYDNINIIILPYSESDAYKITPTIVENVISKINDDTNDTNDKTNNINIVAITACSNVLGFITPIKQIYEMLQKYNNNKEHKTNILIVDYACLAPYVKIDAKFVDALCLSPHKYIGGHSTPGLIIASEFLFNKNLPPFCPGGNCTKKVCSKGVIYSYDIETKETGGTPNIIGIIKFGQVLKLQQQYLNFIKKKEKLLTLYIYLSLSQFKDNYSSSLVILGSELEAQQMIDRLPILCISIRDIHYNLLVVALNDLYGIQTRGGVSCTALLSEYMDKKYGIIGWCRISFHWLIDLITVDYILDAIKYICSNIDTIKNNYVYNPKTNLFTYSEQKLNIANKKAYL